MKPPGTIDWSAVRAKLAEGERRLDEVLHPAPETIARILERRAGALRTRRLKTVEKSVPHLVAIAGTDRYIIAASAVTEIVKIEMITPVPGAPILGIIAIRGDFFSLLPPVASAATAGQEAPKWAVVLRHPQHQVALAFTRIEMIAEVPASILSQRVAGAVIQTGGDLATLLDPDAILQRLETAHPRLSL